MLLAPDLQEHGRNDTAAAGDDRGLGATVDRRAILILDEECGKHDLEKRQAKTP